VDAGSAEACYAKNFAESIPVHLLRRIRKEIEDA